MGKPTGKSCGITYTPRRVPAVGCSYTLSCDFRILSPSMILHAENPSIFLAFCCSWIDEKARSSACSVFVSFSDQWCRWERCFLFLSMFSSTEQSQIYQCKVTKSPQLQFLAPFTHKMDTFHGVQYVSVQAFLPSSFGLRRMEWQCRTEN